MHGGLLGNVLREVFRKVHEGVSDRVLGGVGRYDIGGVYTTGLTGVHWTFLKALTCGH
jgi:hypothetical protein